MSLIRLALPKGSLQSSTIELFRDAGWNISTSSRSYFPSIDDEDIECALVRAQEVPDTGGVRPVRPGPHREGLDTRERLGRRGVGGPRLLEGHLHPGQVGAGRGCRVARAHPGGPEGREDSDGARQLHQAPFAERGIEVEVEFSWGATEAKVVEDLADAIVK